MAASIKCDERPFKGGVWGGFAPPAKNWGVWGAAPPSQNFSMLGLGVLPGPGSDQPDPVDRPHPPKKLKHYLYETLTFADGDLSFGPEQVLRTN